MEKEKCCCHSKQEEKEPCCCDDQNKEIEVKQEKCCCSDNDNDKKEQSLGKIVIRNYRFLSFFCFSWLYRAFLDCFLFVRLCVSPLLL